MNVIWNFSQNHGLGHFVFTFVLYMALLPQRSIGDTANKVQTYVSSTFSISGPTKIYNPGSYVLTQDIVDDAPKESTILIQTTKGKTSLDLNGFSVFAKKWKSYSHSKP